MRPNLSRAAPINCTHLVLDGDVGAAEQAGGAELFGKRLAFRRAAAGDDDLCALGHEYFGGA